jgi:CRP-like cAMP-binding protein
MELLRSIPSLNSIAPVLSEHLHDKIMTHDYGKNELVIDEGDRLPGLYIILKGRANAAVRDRMGNNQQVAELLPGDFFGEKASLLSDQVSDVSVLAIDDLEVLVLDTETLQRLLVQIPRFAHALGEVMEARRKAIQVAKNTLQAIR